MFALTGKGNSWFSSTEDGKAPAPFPGTKLLTWQQGPELIHCFPKLPAQRECCWRVWQVFECISNPRQSRDDLNNCAGLFVPVCWLFEVASVICRWERKFLLPDICSASVTEVVQPALGCWNPQLSQLQEEELEGAITALPLSSPLQGLAFL